MASLPPALAARARATRVGLEVGAGARFDTALAFAAANPAARWIVTDIDARVMLAPAALEARSLDLLRPDLEGLQGVDLVYAVRLPEELQLAAARLAHGLSADLALRPLKDEWADISTVYHKYVSWPDGWRYFPIE